MKQTTFYGSLEAGAQRFFKVFSVECGRAHTILAQSLRGYVCESVYGVVKPVTEQPQY